MAAYDAADCGKMQGDAKRRCQSIGDERQHGRLSQGVAPARVGSISPSYVGVFAKQHTITPRTRAVRAPWRTARAVSYDLSALPGHPTQHGHHHINPGLPDQTAPARHLQDARQTKHPATLPQAKPKESLPHQKEIMIPRLSELGALSARHASRVASVDNNSRRLSIALLQPTRMSLPSVLSVLCAELASASPAAEAWMVKYAARPFVPSRLRGRSLFSSQIIKSSTHQVINLL